jgi:hypothetical protein
VTGGAAGTDHRPSRAGWAWAGVALAFCGVIAWFLITSIALDSDDDVAPSGPVGAALRRASDAEAPFTGLTAIQLGVGGDCKRVVVADTVEERGQGLRGRRDLAGYDGMLFVFDAPAPASFTMSGVPVPLDIGFYDAGGRPVSRQHMEPCAKAVAECPAYVSNDESLYALETEAGELASGSLGACPS